MSARDAAARRPALASRPTFSRPRLHRRSLLATSVTVLSLVTSCSLIPGTPGHDASPLPPTSTFPTRAAAVVGAGGGVTVTIPAGAVPAGTTVTVSQQPLTGFNPPPGVTALTPLTTVDISTEPTAAAAVTFPAPASLSATLRPMVLWQDGHGGWRGVPTTWSPGSSQVVASVDHFSGGFLAAIDVNKTAETASARIRDYVTGRSGVAQPSCGDEAGARAGGVRVTSDGGDSVKWCFGRENGQTVVKVANNRRTFTEIDYPQTWAVKDGGALSFSTDTVARALGTAVAGTPGTKARIVDGGDTLTLVLPSDRPARPEEVHALISSEAWLVQALFFGLDVFGTVVETTYTALGKGAASIGPRVLAVFSGSANDDVYKALRACGKAAGDLTNGPVTAGATTALLKFGLACAPQVGKAVLLDGGVGRAVSIVVDAIATLAALVLTGVNLFFTGLRELYDDLVSLGGASTPDYTIRVAPIAPPVPAPAQRDPRAWAISPGQIGPIKVGMTGSQLAVAGYAVRPSDEACGQKWVSSDALRAAGISLEFRYGVNADDLDQISVGSDTSRPVSRGVGLGSTPAAIRAAYGAELHEVTLNGGESGDNVMGVAFGPSGALLYYLRGITYPTSGTGTVKNLELTRGTSMTNVGYFGTGC